MTRVKKLTAVLLAFFMLISSVTVLASAWDPQVDDGKALTIATKIYRQVNGEWIETQKVKEGENVKARVFLTTDYFANFGTLLFFYDNDFFTSNYTSAVSDVTVGSYYAANPYGISGTVRQFQQKDRLVQTGMIDSEFAAANDALIIDYGFASGATSQKFSATKANGDPLWAFEVDLQVKTGLDADARGDFKTLSSVNMTPANNRGRNNISKGPSGTTLVDARSMSTWDANVTITSQDVGLFTNPVTVTFMTNGGEFGDGTTTAVFEGDAGDPLTVETPAREGYTLRGWIPEGGTAVETVSAYPDADTVYNADWKNNAEDTEGTLFFDTDFVRYDEEAGEWVQTDRVAPGEDVKVRLYIDTDYTTNTGRVMLFYEKSFFEDDFEYNRDYSLNVNSNVTDAGTSPTALVRKLNPATNSQIRRMLEAGSITQADVDNNNVYTVMFELQNNTVSTMNGDEWFVEIPMRVREDAASADSDRLGVSYVDTRTVYTPANDEGGYTNIAFATPREDQVAVVSMGLWLVYVDIDSHNNPVSLESTITFDANGGTFPDEGNAATVDRTDVIGTAVTADLAPTPDKGGATFRGWMDENNEMVEIPADLPEFPHNDVTLYAVWIDEVELTFVYNNGTADETKTVTTGDPFENPADPNPTLEGNHFIGWTTDETYAEITGLPDVNPGADTTYYAVFEPATYIARYYMLNPSTLNFERIHSARVPYGDPIPTDVPAEVIPEGYTLSGAYKEYTFVTPYTSDDTMPANSIDLFYRATANEYQAIFDANGGAFPDDETTKSFTKLFGDSIEAPEEDPVRDGYVFTGWDPVPDIMDEPADKTFYATWEGNHHTLTYLNDDDSTYETYDIATGDDKDVPADPVKEGYEFVGWVPSDAEYIVDNAIAADTLSAEQMPDADLTYKAFFEVQQYHVTFYADADTTTDPVTYGDVVQEGDVTFGEPIDIPADPTKEGYTFVGWDPEVPDTMPAEDQIFVAQWEINTHNVKYIADETIVLDQDVVYHEPIPTAEVPAKEGYTPAGWTPDPSTYDFMPDEDLVFYAVYEVNSYNLTWDANTGAWADDSTVKGPTATEFGTDLVLPENPAKEGYVFAGWAETADAEEADVITPTTMPAADTTYYAVWTPGEVAYTVEYYLMDVEGNYPDPTEFVYEKTGVTGETATADIAIPEGYELDTDNADYLAEAEIAPDGSTVLKVFYKRIEYTVTFDANGGELALPEDASATYLYGQTLSEPADPSRTGYTFAGWSPELVRVVTADADYVAQWEINQYDIIYMSEGEEVDRDSFDYQAVPTDYDGETPTKEGYTFTGWDVELPATMPAENVTRTALFEINSYDAIFDPNTGAFEGEAPNAVVTYGEPIPMPTEAQNPVKEGYAFQGWAETPDAEEPLDDLGTMPEGGKTFYAVWAPDFVDYTVEYYYQQLDDSYVLNPDPAEVVSNVKKTGEIAEVLPAEVEGYQLNEGESVLSAEVLADGSTILVVKYDLITYNLTVDLDNGTEPTVTPYRYGEQIEQPEEPTEADKPGYSFDGWMVVGGEFDDTIPDTMPANNVGATAKWVKNWYSLTFLVDGEPYANTPRDVEFEDVIDEPTDPTKTGYDFQGWALEDDPNTVVELEATMPDHALTYVAVFEPAEQDYVLSIYVMGTDGSYPADPTEVKTYTGHTMDDIDVTADAQAAIEEGFHEDADQANNTTTVLMPNGVREPLVYYIARDEHTLTVLNEEGTETVSETPYLYGADVEAPVAPDKEGYEFDKWVDEDGNPVEIPATMGLEDITVKPTYRAIPYNATFDANGGKFYDNSTQQIISVDYDAAITAPAVDPTWTGYDFQGWAATSDATEALADLGSMDDTNGKTFYAVWTPADFTATYYVKNPTTGDFEQQDQQTVAFNDVIPAINYTAPEGYELSVAYENITMTTALADGATMPAADKDLYYKLTPINYTATFYEEDGTTVIGEPATVAYGAAIPTPAAPAVEGKTFAGWNPEVPATMPAENQSFTATYTLNDYTVTYLVDGVTQETQTYHFNDTITPATAPTKEGYTFDGWYDGTNTALPATMPSKDLTVTAKYTINTHALKFIVDDVAVVDEAAVAYGTALATYKPADPTKEGYTFTGWTPEVPATMPDADQTFTAQWQKNSYTATYLADDATVRVDTVEFEAVLPEAPDAPDKDGYTFTGWTPDAPDTMPAEDLTFTAVYEPNEYTLKFINNDDAGTVWDEGVTFGDAITAPPEGTKAGYVFSGWALEEDPTTVVPVAANMPATNLTYVGVWEPDISDYTVESYLMDLDGTYPADPYLTYGSTGTTGETVTAEPGLIPHYHVDDTHAAEATGEVAADGSLVLKLYYALDEVTITFNGNGGLIGTSPVKEDSYLYGQTVSVPDDSELSRPGYHFLGWDRAVVLIANEDATYNAQWEINSYTVTYISEGETFETQTYEHGDALVLPTDTPTKEGYEFDSWAADENGSVWIQPAAVEEDIVVYAQFNPIPYLATFYLEVDADPDDYYAQEEVPFDEPIADYQPLDPVDAKVGYTFEGWSTDGVTPLADLGTMDSTEGKTFYAVWAPAEVDYTVEHYFQNVDGTYPTTADPIENLQAPSDSTVTATPIDRAYFTVNGTLSVLTDTVDPQGNTVLKVYYDRKASTVTVDKNDGSEPEEIEGLYEAPIDPAIEEPTRDGYTFGGWVDENDQPVDVPTTIPGEDTTIIATWTPLPFTLKYVNEDTEVVNETIDCGSDIASYIPQNPIRDGYSFVGWFTEEDEQPAAYPTMPAKDLTFTARWAATENRMYLLEVYEMDTEGNYPADPTSTYTFNNGVVGTTVSPVIEVPTGFTLDTTNANSILTGEIPAAADETLVLKAYLARNMHTLTTVVDGVETEYPYYYNAAVTPIDDPVKEGSDFLGWFDAAEDGNEVTIPRNMPDEDVTVYAHFELNSYDATFDAGEGKFPTTDQSTDTTPYPFGDPINAPAEDPEREGYEFLGWATPEDPDTVIDDYGTMDSEDGKTFVAVWSKTASTATFYSYVESEHGPVLDPTLYVVGTQTSDFETDIVFPAGNPSADMSWTENYTFLGWSTVENDASAIVDTENQKMPAEDINYYAIFERVKVMLIPKNDTCTTVIDRNGGTVDDYDAATSYWYVYGLKEMIKESSLRDNYCDVQGDGYFTVTRPNNNYAPYTGTGTVIDVYDAVTGELVESFWIIIYGDVDGNAYLDTDDTAMVRNEIAGKTGWSWDDDPEWCHYKLKASDLDKDGGITSTDAKQLRDAYTYGVIDQRTGEITYSD